MSILNRFGLMKFSKMKFDNKWSKKLEKMAIGALSSTVVAWLYHKYNVKSGRVNPTGSHKYITEIELGDSDEVGTAIELFKKFKNEPWKYFPLGFKGGKLEKGGEAGLSILPFRLGQDMFPKVPFLNNKVSVEDVTDTSVTLKAKEHTFEGEAEHGLKDVKKGNRKVTIYYVRGAGPNGKVENLLKQNFNVMFADIVWPLAIKFNTMTAFNIKPPPDDDPPEF
jgi:hypothetical protein